MTSTASAPPLSVSPSPPQISSLRAATRRSRAASSLPSRQERLPARITGDVDTGKSTALRAFIHSLDHNVYAVVYLSNPHLSVTTLYRQILLALQTEPAFGFSRLLPQLRASLDQRISARYRLKPFDLEESAAYVKHHLRVAGRQACAEQSRSNPIFSDGFISLVHDHTKGVARKINNLCRTALLLGATEHKPILDETDLKRVILDLEGQPN